MDRSLPNRASLRRAALPALPALTLAACAELATVADVVFPVSVPGLPTDQPWTSLPVRRWLTEGPIEPVAISACMEQACTEPAVAGLFRARGAGAAALRRAASDPAAFMSTLAQPRPGRGLSRRTPARGRIASEPAEEGGRPGLAVRITRPDGRMIAGGYVAAIDTGDATQVLVIVAGSEAGARRIARGVVPRL